MTSPFILPESNWCRNDDGDGDGDNNCDDNYGNHVNLHKVKLTSFVSLR